MARPHGKYLLVVDHIMVKRVLMIAFHFPPMHGSSSIQRTLKFAEYLPQHGWEAVVLSAHPRAYAATRNDQLSDAFPVHRSFALDSGRHLALGGRYPWWLAMPDRWVSWWCSAVPAALRLIRRYRPQLVWSTFPIATAHLIALSVRRLSGLPWVADQRDPMTDHGYPPDPRTHRVFSSIEARAALRCSRMVCTTPGAVSIYQQRFPALPANRFALIENGYDEPDFGRATRYDKPDHRFTLLHSGVVYPSERDPVPLFGALARLKAAAHIGKDSFRLIFRASGHDGILYQHIAALGLQDIVELAPSLPYHQALGEMLVADGLLLLQGSSCNAQIPAKLYEYLRAGRPVLALTDQLGDTAALLRQHDGATIAPMDQQDAIAGALLAFMSGSATSPRTSATMPGNIIDCSRAARTGQLASLFDQILEAQ
jgi:glycosyltransferase involved in cell wall biosynthesis